ncbi:MAG: hypothetical protein JW736_00830 [Deltaproteobacteria bacterium]|jgi:hypothetical protein|nr:hypothetical protein [Deltaproteobacteria bacterium]MBN2687502.1 hypothetical protein [Deltaproteobacteria bacterium]
MAGDVNDLTIEYEEDGLVIVQEIDKVILSKGAWATILYRYRQWDHRNGEYGQDLYTIRRYRKVSGKYTQQSKFNISSKAQAVKLIEALKKWTDEPAE